MVRVGESHYLGDTLSGDLDSRTNGNWDVNRTFCCLERAGGVILHNVAR